MHEDFYTTQRSDASAPSVSTLRAAVLNISSGVIADETHRAYVRALRSLEEQLGDQPVSDRSLSAALSALAADGRAASTLAQSVSAVRFAARRASLPDPVGTTSEMIVRSHRRSSQPPRQAPGIDWDAADAAAEALARRGGPIGLRNAALIAIMSDALLRVSEAAALDVGDIERASDGTGRVVVRRSKTDQNGDGATLYLRACTMDRINVWLAECADDDDSSPLFRRVLRGGRVTAQRLSGRSISTAVAEAAAAVGIEGASSHSLRVGAAQSLVSNGAELPEAMLAGRWTSPAMLARYARRELAGRSAVAKLRPEPSAS